MNLASKETVRKLLCGVSEAHIYSEMTVRAFEKRYLINIKEPMNITCAEHDYLTTDLLLDVLHIIVHEHIMSLL